MSESKFRIPRMAAAALVLGGACSDDNNSNSAAGTNVTSSRVNKLADMYCSQELRCDPEGFAEDYDSKADCVRSYSSYFRSYVQTYGKDCADAIFDLIECDFSPACEQADDYGDYSSDDYSSEEDDKCAALQNKLDAVCPAIDDSGDSSDYSSNSLNNVAAKSAARPARRSLRIPR